MGDIETVVPELIRATEDIHVNAPIDVLVVGAGPAGLAAAIRLRQLLAATSSDASVVVIDKSPWPGYHCLSGAAFEPAALDQLRPRLAR